MRLIRKEAIIIPEHSFLNPKRICAEKCREKTVNAKEGRKHAISTIDLQALLGVHNHRDNTTHHRGHKENHQCSDSNLGVIVGHHAQGNQGQSRTHNVDLVCIVVCHSSGCGGGAGLFSRSLTLRPKIRVGKLRS